MPNNRLTLPIPQTLTALRTFVMAMILNPDVYKKAQAEIDRVIGEERLLDFDDREKLPYVDCVLTEVLRYDTLSLLIGTAPTHMRCVC